MYTYSKRERERERERERQRERENPSKMALLTGKPEHEPEVADTFRQKRLPPDFLAGTPDTADLRGIA